MSIPKIIHYVWVGGKDKPNDIQKCMKTWKKHLEEYQIIEWSESNFDIQSNTFVKHAYEQKKWAYVSDYIRAYAIYTMGGIYLDTDVLVLDNLESFLKNKAFVGFENPNYPFTAVFGAEKGHPFVKDMLDYYDDIDFEFNREDQFDKVNTKTVSSILIDKYNCKANNQFQLLNTGIAVYPDGILCNPTKDSSTIHVFTGTWVEGEKPFIKKLNQRIRLNLTTKKRAFLYRKYIRK